MSGIHSADKADSQPILYPCHGTCVAISAEHWALAGVLNCTLGLQNVGGLAQMSTYIR